MFQVPERDGGPGREPPGVVLAVPVGFGLVPPFVGTGHQGTGERQVPEGTPEQDRLVAWNVYKLGCTAEQGFRFAPSGCTTEQDFQDIIQQEEYGLLRCRRVVSQEAIRLRHQ